MRKNLLKKYAAFAFASIIAAGTVLTGCGSSSSSASSTAGASSSSSAAEASSTTAEASSTAAGNGKKITVTAVTGADPKPYVYVDKNNNPTGYDIEVLKKVFENLPDYDLKIEVTDFDGLFAGLQSGQYQIGVNNFSYNSERAKSYLYTLPYNTIAYDFIYKKGAKPITSWDDVAGKTFEGASGISVTSAVESWNKKHPDKAVKITYTEGKTPLQLQHIEDGTTDFGIIDKAMFDSYQKEYHYNIEATEIPEDQTKDIASSLNAYFILPKDQKKLRDEISEQIKKLAADGTLKELSEKYEGYDGTPTDEELAKTPN